MRQRSQISKKQPFYPSSAAVHGELLIHHPQAHRRVTWKMPAKSEMGARKMKIEDVERVIKGRYGKFAEKGGHKEPC